jgi:hypothetical protein
MRRAPRGFSFHDLLALLMVAGIALMLGMAAV